MVKVSTESAGSLMIKSINIIGNHYFRVIERKVPEKQPLNETKMQRTPQLLSLN